MKNKKTKLISIVLIGFFCVLIGSPFIKGETSTKTLAPNQYWGLGTTLQTGDTLNFRIESDSVSINIYIMNQGQIDFYQGNPQDEATFYIEEWVSYWLLTYSFVAPNDEQYYLLMINPSDSTSTYVVVDASVDEYIQSTITITNPTSIDTFDSGYNHITWTSTGEVSYWIDIDLYKNGAFLESIVTVGNGGFYSWYIYNDEYEEDSDYQIRISDSYDSSIYDLSDYFTIECELELLL